MTNVHHSPADFDPYHRAHEQLEQVAGIDPITAAIDRREKIIPWTGYLIQAALYDGAAAVDIAGYAAPTITAPGIVFSPHVRTDEVRGLTTVRATVPCIRQLWTAAAISANSVPAAFDEPLLNAARARLRVGKPFAFLQELDEPKPKPTQLFKALRRSESSATSPRYASRVVSDVPEMCQLLTDVAGIIGLSDKDTKLYVKKVEGEAQLIEDQLKPIRMAIEQKRIVDSIGRRRFRNR